MYNRNVKQKNYKDMKKVQNILWISMVLSGVLFCISMKGENLDMMAFSVGIAIIAVILNIPFLRYGDNKKLTSDFFFFILILSAISFCVGIFTDRVMLYITTGAFTLAAVANALLAHYKEEPGRSKAN